MCRFINADSIIDAGGILGYNMFAYCNNNPTNSIDSQGCRTYIINGINNPDSTNAPKYAENLKDELIKQGVENVQTISVYNETGVVSGTVKVVAEMLNCGQYSEEVANYILNDLANNPLAEGEELNLIGYSGGGQIVLNVCELLEGKANVTNSVLIGAPVSELTLNNTGKTISIYAGFDPLSWNISWYPVTFKFAGWFGHLKYFNEKNIKKIARIIDNYIN